MKSNLFKVLNCLLIFGLIISLFILNYVKELKVQDYTAIYNQEIYNLQQKIPMYKVYERSHLICSYEALYDLNDLSKQKKIKNSCETLQKTACELYPKHPNCLTAIINNAQNKAGLNDYKKSLELLKSVEKPALDYFNNRRYYDPDPAMINSDLYATYSKIYFKMGEYIKADYYTEVTANWGKKEYKPNSGLTNYAYLQLADNYFKSKNYQKAIDYYKKIRVNYTFLGFIKDFSFASKDIFQGSPYAKSQIKLCKKKLKNK